MKVFCWNFHRVGNPAIVCKLRQLLVANGSILFFFAKLKFIQIASLVFVRRVGWRVAWLLAQRGRVAAWP